MITADDFGASVEINAAVEQAHRQGVLTAASLMVSGPSAADAVARVRTMPSLRVGLHLVLLDGQSMLGVDEIPDLVDDDRRFRHGMMVTAVAALSSSIRRQMADEIVAQFRAFQATGLPLDHVNAHQHLQLHPWIARLILTTGPTYGMRALRLPLEPWAALRRAGGGIKAAFGIERLPARMLRYQLRKSPMIAPDRVFGLAWSGKMDRARLGQIVANLPFGLSEIYMHPAVKDDFAGATPGYRYKDELRALTDPEVAGLIATGGIRVGGFADFAL